MSDTPLVTNLTCTMSSEVDEVVDPFPNLPPYDVGTVLPPRTGPDGQLTVSILRAETGGWASDQLRIPEWWKETEGEGVTIAVLDTGCDLDHPDLQDAIVCAKSFVPRQSIAEDGEGHGTHCCGVIAARKDGDGFVGVAPKASLLVGKVLGDDGGGAFSWITRGIRWAVESGADIITMSLGAPIATPDLHQAIHEAILAGKIVIAAAGNEGRMGGATVGYPARYGSVISVASHNRSMQRSGFSSRGGEVDFMAPGEDIWSTYKKGGYATLSGTSMATPFVAGLAALILAKHKRKPSSATPIYNNEDMRNHLMRMAEHPSYFDPETGYGALLPYNYFTRKR